ncbi:hypothetical protein Q31a_25940 [Aureliella helgolandensis]|uniref:Uncharacterized protein n=1 Tax=Aureliella helgolandensis TaxID=2527968 RepID=A0A518G6S0_9BACT|nr:hypothetical protein Q31a_25940 [Aureliella helgolandensis]
MLSCRRALAIPAWTRMAARVGGMVEAEWQAAIEKVEQIAAADS